MFVTPTGRRTEPRVGVLIGFAPEILGGKSQWTMDRREMSADGHGSIEFRTVAHGELERRYRVYRATRLAERTGLVLVLHGAVGSGVQIAELTRFDEQAERLGWIAAYPDAHEPGLPHGGWSTYATPVPVDDVGFIASIVDELRRSERVDAAYVYAAGFSRGGMLAYRLGCELADRFAAIAAVSANIGDQIGKTEDLACRPSRPISVLTMHGSSDRNVPIEGGVSPDYPDQIPYAPLSDVLRMWLGSNACRHVRDTVRRAGTATVRTWGCPNGARVELWLIERGAHSWPGLNNPPDSPDRAVDASRVIADFFAAHPRPVLETPSTARVPSEEE